MNPDPLQEIWTTQESINADNKENVMNAIQLILAQDQANQEKKSRENLWWLPVHLLILVLLFFFIARGITPMVRAGYGLMAVGLAIMLTVVWLFEGWSRQALPGPMDTRSQLQKAAFLLSRQAIIPKT